jgi:hypothetical protein
MYLQEIVKIFECIVLQKEAISIEGYRKTLNLAFYFCTVHILVSCANKTPTFLNFRSLKNSQVTNLCLTKNTTVLLKVGS